MHTMEHAHVKLCVIYLKNIGSDRVVGRGGAQHCGRSPLCMEELCPSLSEYYCPQYNYYVA